MSKIKSIFVDKFGGPTFASFMLMGFVAVAAIYVAAMQPEMTHNVSCYSENGDKVVDLTVVGNLHTSDGTPYIVTDQGKVTITAQCIISSRPVK